MSTFERSQRNAEVEHVLAALHRICRTALLHRPNNEAVRQTIEQCLPAFSSWQGSGGERLSLLFVDDTLYVNGDLLRLPQEHHEASIAIGETLDRIGCNELALYPGLTQDDLTHLAAAVHSGSAAGASSDALQLRRIDPELLNLLRRSSASARERLQQGYISALVLLRVLDAGALADDVPATGSLRAVVRQLVAAADEDPVAFRSLVVSPLAHQDRPGQCVKAAVLTIECCRWLGADWHMQVQLGMVALLADLARIRAVRAGMEPGSRKLPALPVLDEAQLARLPGAAATIALLSDRPGADVVERAAIAMHAFTPAHTYTETPDLASLLTFVPRICRELTELIAYDVFTQQTLSAAEAVAELRSQLQHTALERAIELVAAVVLADDAQADDSKNTAQAGNAQPAPLPSEGSLLPLSATDARDASVATQVGTPMTTRRPDREGGASATPSRPDPDSAHPVEAGSSRGDTRAAYQEVASSVRPGDTDFTAMVRHYYGDGEAPLTQPADPASTLVTREFRTDQQAVQAPHEPHTVEAAQTAASPAHTDAGSVPRFGRTEPSIPTSAHSQARETLSDGSTGRFRISVDPLTGTLQAEDSQVGSSTDPGLGRTALHSNTLPGLPAAALGPPQHPFDSPDAFQRERRTPAVHLRKATLDTDSQLGANSPRNLRDSDEYDVHVADLQAAQQAEVQSAHLISRAKTPPRPMAAVVQPNPPPVPRSDIPTLEVSATESARILGAFARNRAPLPASELRRALAVSSAEPASHAHPAAPTPEPAAAPKPETTPPHVAAVGGQTRSLGDAIEDARRLAESSLLPDAPVGSTLDMTAPAEAALSSAARLAVQKASQLDVAAAPAATTPATQTAPPLEPNAASGRLRSATRRSEPSGAQPTATAIPAELAPILARAEEWSITQTLDVGAIQARRYLEAFARNQRRRPGAPAEPTESATPTTGTASTGTTGSSPAVPPDSAAEATTSSPPLEPMYDADGTPITWRRSRETVKRLREQRHSGSLPVLARPRRNLADLGDSVDDLLRKYLNDK